MPTRSEEKLPEHIKSVIKAYQSIYPAALLTGSCALILNGFNLGRVPNDIDFILPEPPEKIPKDWVEVKMPNNFQAKCYETDLLGVRVQFIIWSEYVGLSIDGVNVASIYDLIEEKKNLGLTGTKKHIVDFHKMLVQLLAGATLYAEKTEKLAVALKGIRSNPSGCPMCDSGTLRNPRKEHWDDCPYKVATETLIDYQRSTKQ